MYAVLYHWIVYYHIDLSKTLTYLLCSYYIINLIFICLRLKCLFCCNAPGVEFYAELLTSMTSDSWDSKKMEELAALVKKLSLHAAWRAANTRSMMWKDAAKDARRHG